MTRRAERGLSVLEALVAVSILGIALGSLMEWRATLARQHARVTALAADMTAQRNALALLADMNPMATPDGRLDVGDGSSLAWRAAPLTQPRRSVAYPAGDGAFRVALYRVDATITAPSRAPVSFSVERLGWAPLEPTDGP